MCSGTAEEAAAEEEIRPFSVCSGDAEEDAAEKEEMALGLDALVQHLQPLPMVQSKENW